MPFRRVIDLLRYWGESPPVAESVAWYLGIRKPQDGPAPDVAAGPPMTEDEARAMVAQLNGE